MVRATVIRLSTELELWAVALWVEKRYGTEGKAYIEHQRDRLPHEDGGEALWREVAQRYEKLTRQHRQN